MRQNVVSASRSGISDARAVVPFDADTALPGVRAQLERTSAAASVPAMTTWRRGVRSTVAPVCVRSSAFCGVARSSASGSSSLASRDAVTVLSRTRTPPPATAEDLPVHPSPPVSAAPTGGSLGRYRWAAPGDINAFFGLILDNVVNLAILAGILVGAFGFPADIVYTRMFPGTALGVMIGDLAYTWLAFRLAKRTGRSDVTAMPLGLDSPSTIGMAFAVLGPAFLAAKARMPEADAAILAWQVGMAAMVIIGVFKLVLTFFGDAIRRVVPQAGLLGSIGGVGIALLGTLQLGEVFSEPIAGMIAFGIILYALVARIRLPFRVPEVLASVVIGAAIYYGLGAAGLLLHPITFPAANFPLAFPVPTLGFLEGLPIEIGRASCRERV